MRIKILLFSLTIWSVQSNKLPKDGVSRLAYKKGFYNDTKVTAVGTNTFLELVRKSNVFVDNTLFIHDIIKSPASEIIYSPSGWGRSTKLDMLKLFLELPVDEQGNKLPIESTNTYKLFANGEIIYEDGHMEELHYPLYIGERPLDLKRHLGRYPVIFTKFENTSARTYEEVLPKIVEAIRSTFQHHVYMIKVLERKFQETNNASVAHNLQLFEQYLAGNVTDEKGIIYSLRFLFDLLYDYFQTKIYLILDDYDKPFHGFFEYPDFDPLEADRILEFVDRFMENYEFLFWNKKLVTGTFSINHTKWAHHFWYRPAEVRQPLHAYFGFDEPVVVSLSKPYEMQSHLNDMKSWYNGHKVSFYKYAAYTVKSVIKYFNTKEIKCYRDDKNVQFIKTVLKTTPRWREKIFLLLSKQPIADNFELMKPQIRNFVDIWNDNKTLSSFGDQIAYSFLITEAYVIAVARLPYKKHSEIVHIKAVNNENNFVMANWLIECYQQIYQFSDDVLQQAAISLFNDFRRPDNVIESLQSSLQTLYEMCSPRIETNPQQAKNSSVKILHNVALRMQCVEKFVVDVYYNSMENIDLVIIDFSIQQGAIVQLTYDKSVQQAYQLAEKQKHQFRSATKINKLKLIGINLSTDKKVQILTNVTLIKDIKI